MQITAQQYNELISISDRLKEWRKISTSQLDDLTGRLYVFVEELDPTPSPSERFVQLVFEWLKEYELSHVSTWRHAARVLENLLTEARINPFGAQPPADGASEAPAGAEGAQNADATLAPECHLNLVEGKHTYMGRPSMCSYCGSPEPVTEQAQIPDESPTVAAIVPNTLIDLPLSRLRELREQTEDLLVVLNEGLESAAEMFALAQHHRDHVYENRQIARINLSNLRKQIAVAIKERD